MPRRSAAVRSWHPASHWSRPTRRAGCTRAPARRCRCSAGSGRCPTLRWCCAAPTTSARTPAAPWPCWRATSPCGRWPPAPGSSSRCATRAGLAAALHERGLDPPLTLGEAELLDQRATDRRLRRTRSRPCTVLEPSAGYRWIRLGLGRGVGLSLGRRFGNLARPGHACAARSGHVGGAGGRPVVRWDSTTSCRSTYVDRKAWIVAAAGRRQDGPDRAEQRRPGDDRREGDGRVQLHGARRDAWGEEVVLDLLVDDHEPEHPQRLQRRLGQRDEHREQPGEVGAHDGHELRHDAHEQGQHLGEVEPDGAEGDVVEQRRQQGQQPAGVEVAAGLVDGQVPAPQHLALEVGAEHGAHRPPEAWAVGDEVEGEQQHRQQLEQRAERGQAELQRRAGQALGQLASRPAFLGELVDEVVDVHVGVEGVVDPGLELLEVVGRLVDQVADLAHDQRPDRRHEHEADQRDDQHREPCRQASPPAPPHQRVHGGFDGQGEEERDHDHHQQRLQPLVQAEQDPQRRQAEPEGDDRPGHPPRHALAGSVRLWFGRGCVVGHPRASVDIAGAGANRSVQPPSSCLHRREHAREGSWWRWKHCATPSPAPSGAGWEDLAVAPGSRRCSPPTDRGGSTAVARSGRCTPTPPCSSGASGPCCCRASTRWRWPGWPSTPTSAATPGAVSSAPPTSSPAPRYGTVEQAEAACAQVRAVHRRVVGVAADGRRYAANDPHLLAWVHIAEVDSFLTAHRRFGKRPLDRTERDQYVADMAVVARALGVVEPPRSVAALRAQLAAFRPEARGHARGQGGGSLPRRAALAPRGPCPLQRAGRGRGRPVATVGPPRPAASTRPGGRCRGGAAGRRRAHAADPLGAGTERSGVRGGLRLTTASTEREHHPMRPNPSDRDLGLTATSTGEP